MSTADVQSKPWALLAYTVADDHSGGGSLDASAKEELKALCDAADFGRVSIAAQVDFKHTKGVFRGSLTAPPPKSRGFEDVRAEDHALWRKILRNVKQSTLRVQVEHQDLNAAGSNVLEEFLGFGRRECPAARHVIVFYGHAYGPMGLFYDRDSTQDESHTLRLNDLAGAMQMADGRAAVVLFRDCFMNTLETACQLAGVSEFMIASQSEVPIAGIWPWASFMTALMPSASSGDVAKALAAQLGRFLDEPANRGPYPDVPIAAIDLGAVGAITGPLKALASALDDARRDPARSRACAQALEGARSGYSSKDHVRPGDPALLDVPTLCDSLQALGSDPVAGPAKALGDAVRTQLVTWQHSQQGRYQGASIYYKPVTERDLERSNIQAGDDVAAESDANAYRTLALNKDTGWDRVALNPLAPSGAA